MEHALTGGLFSAQSEMMRLPLQGTLDELKNLHTVTKAGNIVLEFIQKNIDFIQSFPQDMEKQMAARLDLKPINEAFQQIDNFLLARTKESDSELATDNPHRPLLENLRNDLYHYDEEKKARILYNLNRYLSQNPQEDPELKAVLERVYEVMTHFQQTHEILISPVKPLPSVQHTPISPNSNIRRKLFEDGK